MKEFDFIAKYFAPLSDSLSGLNLKDDAACLTPPTGKDLIITTDTLVEGVHYLAGTSPADVAIKLVGVNLSDLAAKGAKPLGCFLNFTPVTPDENWVAAFAQAFGEQLKHYDFLLMGGDSAVHPSQAVFSLTVFGVVKRGGMVKRAGAKAGDIIYVSGCIGAGGLGLQDAKDRKDTAFSRHYLRPQPLLALGQALAPHISAAIDMSDGLLADLGHICKASDCAADIRLQDIPLAKPQYERMFQLSCGDDYQLIFTTAQKNQTIIEKIAHQQGVLLTPIGQISKNKKNGLYDETGKKIELTRSGWTHY